MIPKIFANIISLHHCFGVSEEWNNLQVSGAKEVLIPILDSDLLITTFSWKRGNNLLYVA